MKLKQKNINIKTSRGIFKTVFKSWDVERGYCVRVPDFPEIVTGGDTLIEAKKMAREAIEFCLECREHEHHSYSTGKEHHRFIAQTRV